MADDESADVGIGFKVPAGIADRLAELQDAVRDKGHHRPSQRVMVSALIFAAESDPETIELEILAPFRLAYPNESRD
jgi:hypothetical protein